MSEIDTTITGFFTQLLGFEPEIEINTSSEEVIVKLTVEPELSGMLIGYRGEVLSSLQLLLTLMLQPGFSSWTPVRLDINEYRQQRVSHLEEMAHNAAERAISTKGPVVLDRLSSYERRVIHTTLTDHPEVETFSQGEAPNRVLVVAPKSDISL